MLSIDIENLELAKEELPTVDSKELMKSYLKGDLLGTSSIPSKIVDGKSHSFLQAMYYCYSDHRPFVLTPESIWLLIMQAFSVHINNNSKKFIKKYPRFKTKRKLHIRKDKINWDSSEECKNVVFEFCKKLDDEIGDGFVNNLSNKFSTTTEDEEIVFKITTMNTVKSFFEFIVVTIICGIPKVHITGEQEDWLEIISRLEYLRDFEFDWFVDEIIHLIKRISREYEEEVDDDFWINMFKIHTVEKYGRPEMIDGWITKFFPYANNGQRINKEYFETTAFRHVVKNLNPQIVSLDFKHMYQNLSGGTVLEKPMLMIAGFIGIIQDKNTLSLKPHLGWAISENSEKISELVSENKNNILVYHKLEKFPEELLKIKEIKELVLNFENQISVPKEINQLGIGFLRLNGKISRREKNNIREIFENEKTLVLINGEDVNTTFLDKAKEMVMRLSPFHKKYIDY